jgi:hypothetical protein
MIYSGPDFLQSYYSALRPPPPLPLSSPIGHQQVVSLSEFSCVLPVELTDGSGAEGVGEEHRDSRVTADREN